MASCAHQQWLRLYRDENGFLLNYGNRLHNITKSLPHPAKQSPSLVFFVGSKLKARVLRALFPGNGISNCRRYGIANICVDPATISDDHPVLIADSCPDRTQLNPRGKDACHETISRQVAWPDEENGRPTQQDLVDHVHARLLSLFIDVLCMFAQDCGGLDGVAEILATWTAIGSASSLPSNVRPRLVIITSISRVEFNSEALRFRLRVLSDPKFSESFSALRVVNILGSSRRLSREGFSGLGSIIQDETNMARLERIHTHILFSMIHSMKFFDKALHNFAILPQHTFDFISCTREENPVSPNFQHHLESFMSLCSEHKLPEYILWDFVASVIILDGFPADMHFFNPSEVFCKFYRYACLLGIHEFTSALQLSTELICTDIETHIISMFSRIKHEGQSAATIRQQSLQRNSQYWKLLKSNLDCFICFQRKPEHTTECGHGICDYCIRIPVFSKPVKGREYHYNITTCPQCQAKICFQAKVLPPTCRARALSIDGGGSRGIVSLAFMEKLEKALDLPYLIQEHFDFSIGTSSGGIVNIGLFGKYWTPKQCLSFFHKFAKKIFPSRAGVKHLICARIRRIFAFYLEDGKYDATILEENLEEALGSGRIYGPAILRPSGMKYAVTATTISDATLCLISNYNGDGNQSKDLRYKQLRARRPTEEILLWEAARCTTAAPTYFKPKYLPSFGTFQDGGLKYNNPVRPGLREVHRIWGDSDCDLVLSIGTGFEQKLMSPVDIDDQHVFRVF